MYWEDISPSKRRFLEKRAKDTQAIKPVKEVKNLPCPDCGRYMHLRESIYGRYYKCPVPGCKGTHGARLDGTPSGVPGNEQTHVIRRQVVEAFSKLAVVCKQNKRDFAKFHAKFYKDWQGNPHIDKRDEAECITMLQQIEALIKEAASNWFTMVRDGFLDED